MIAKTASVPLGQATTSHGCCRGSRWGPAQWQSAEVKPGVIGQGSAVTQWQRSLGDDPRGVFRLVSHGGNGACA
jgi:hypothetical protein